MVGVDSAAKLGSRYFCKAAQQTFMSVLTVANSQGPGVPEPKPSLFGSGDGRERGRDHVSTVGSGRSGMPSWSGGSPEDDTGMDSWAGGEETAALLNCLAGMVAVTDMDTEEDSEEDSGLASEDKVATVPEIEGSSELQHPGNALASVLSFCDTPEASTDVSDDNLRTRMRM